MLAAADSVAIAGARGRTLKDRLELWPGVARLSHVVLLVRVTLEAAADMIAEACRSLNLLLLLAIAILELHGLGNFVNLLIVSVIRQQQHQLLMSARTLAGYRLRLVLNYVDTVVV